MDRHLQAARSGRPFFSLVARLQYEKAIPLSGGSPDEPVSLAYALALAGRKDEARAILADLQRREGTTYVPFAPIAAVHAALGDNDKAFEWLERAYERRDFLLALLKVEPMFDKLRGDERFPRLMQRVGLPQ